MVEMLSEELLAIGLNLNASKTKFFTTVHLESLLYLDVSGGLVEVMFGDNFHKYLGRHIPGNLKQRGSAEVPPQDCCYVGKIPHKSPCTCQQARFYKVAAAFVSISRYPNLVVRAFNTSGDTEQFGST